ncbi:MAG TPA: OmpA family protein [Candidatus Acidoferrum sp.]|nr:OmpA family protein [Candidatus Acidoferrum sp.]
MDATPVGAATASGGSARNVGAPISSSAATGTIAPTASEAPAGKSTAGIPKAAIVVVGAVAVVLIVVVVAGAIRAAHRARQEVANAEAAKQLQKSFADFAAAASAQPQKPKTNPAGNANNDLADVVAAANALAQKAQQQGGVPGDAIPGIGGVSSGSASTGGSTGSPNLAPGSPSAIAAESAAANAALIPPPLPKPSPIVPVAASGNQAHDWALEYERTVGGPEADLVVRTGDINNLGFGWPKGFDPFSGKSTPAHPWPDSNHIPPQAPPGTDRIMLGTSVMPVHMVIQHVAGQADRIVADSIVKQGLPSDGYSGSLGDCFLMRDFEAQIEDAHAPIVIASEEEGQKQARLYWAPKCTRERELSMPTPIVLPVGSFRFEIHSVVFQIFADDFQPMPMHSHFQVSLNGTRIPNFEYAINSLDQSGPIGKLLTLELLPEYWPLVESGTVKLLIDDPTTHVPDGYAIDFVRILINPYKFKYQVSLTAHVTDADKHTPIAAATVTAALQSAATDKSGKCELAGMPAGLVIATANAPGYDENSVPVDLVAGQNGNAEIQLHRHQESTAALEQSIAQTGTATIYGIHFDTDSSKIRGDSMAALDAVLGLVKDHPGSRWIIAGHTDNQGNASLNQPLSEARAKSVVTWLKEHGADLSSLVPQGFGATRPVADNATANGRALNRRVEVALAK